MKRLSDVTLIGIDCKDISRLKKAADICQKDIEFGAVKLLSSIPDEDPRVVPIEPINSHEEYSHFCIKRLNDFVDANYALVFQYDGFILNAAAWTDEFLQYDYIGAPWYHFGEPQVGNGGFSLRSKKLLETIQKNYESIGGSLHPEDLWICQVARPALEKMGICFPPLGLAKRFSLEGSQFNNKWTDQFGFHYFPETDISAWIEKNPQYGIENNLTNWARILSEYPEGQRPAAAFIYFLYRREEFKEMYEKIKSGERRYELRCWSYWQLKHVQLKVGDTVVFVCAADASAPMEKLEKKVKSITICRSTDELFEKFKAEDLYPGKNEQQLRDFIDTMPGWEEKLKTGGFIVVEV